MHLVYGGSLDRSINYVISASACPARGRLLVHTPGWMDRTANGVAPPAPPSPPPAPSPEPNPRRRRRRRRHRRARRQWRRRHRRRRPGRSLRPSLRVRAAAAAAMAGSESQCQSIAGQGRSFAALQDFTGSESGCVSWGSADIECMRSPTVFHCPAPTCYCTRAGARPRRRRPSRRRRRRSGIRRRRLRRRRRVRGLVQHRSVPVALQLAPMQRVLGVRPVGDAAAYAERPLHGLVQHRALPEPLPVGQLQRVLELSLA